MLAGEQREPLREDQPFAWSAELANLGRRSDSFLRRCLRLSVAQGTVGLPSPRDRAVLPLLGGSEAKNLISTGDSRRMC